MKRILLLAIIAISFQFTLPAQNFVSPDNQWNVLASGMPQSAITEIFWFEGDSVVNNKTYQKFWISRDSLLNRQFEGLMREDSNVVYFIPPEQNESILYDFNAQIGDTVSIVNYFCFEAFPFVVYDIDTVEYYGMSRKHWYLGIQGEIREIWIEGIGSYSGPLYSAYEMCIVCPYWGLLCFHQQGALQYMKPDETVCYIKTVGQTENLEASALLIKPNPAASGSGFFVESPFRLDEINLFNSSGQLLQNIRAEEPGQIKVLTDGLKPGIYLLRATGSGKVLTQKLVIK